MSLLGAVSCKILECGQGSGGGEGGREGRITPRLDSLKIPFFGVTFDRLKKG